MKKYFISTIQILGIASLAFLGSNCKDEEEIRFEMDDLQDAVNLRIERTSAQFDASDPAAQVELTYYSENSDITSVDIYTDYYSLLEDETSDRYLVETMDGASITNDGSTKNVITLQQLKDAVGLADLAGGDQFSVYHVVTLADGRVYPDTVQVGEDQFVNVEGGIILGATSSFTPRLNFAISCPIENPSFATGTYLFEVIEGTNNSAYGALFPNSATVEVTAESSTVRTFNIAYIPAFGFDTDVTFELACNVVLVGATDSGVGCSAAGLNWIQNPANIGTFNPADDSQITIGIIYNTENDCAPDIGDSMPLKFRLTKQ
jgi:hypothetical protein